MPLTQRQTQLIKSSVPVLEEHGNTITSRFYKEMIDDHKELNNIFNQANQANQHQALALANVLTAYANHISDFGVLAPEIENICHKHASLYITPEQYDIVGKYLLQAMQEVLGSALTQELHDAWAAAYWQIANIMVAREKELLQASDGWTDWRDCRIAEKHRESSEITSFRLLPVNQNGDKLSPYLPGQYISVMTDVPKLKYLQSRQYSLSDAHDPEQGYRISVKKESGVDTRRSDAVAHPGYLSNILHEEKGVGDILQVSHPQGTFSLDPDKDTAAPVVLISAGVGITPMMSMLTALVKGNSTRPISFIHATRSSEAQAFGQDVARLAKQSGRVKRVIFNRNPDATTTEGGGYTHTGRMSLDKLDKESELFIDRKDAEYYICGPTSFMTDMAKTLRGYGVNQERVNLELFGTGSIPSA